MIYLVKFETKISSIFERIFFVDNFRNTQYFSSKFHMNDRYATPEKPWKFEDSTLSRSWEIRDFSDFRVPSYTVIYHFPVTEFWFCQEELARVKIGEW